MRIAFWVLLLPTMVSAQYTFDPVRLDDGQGRDYYYPHIERAGSNLLCIWSSVSDVLIAGHGIHVTPEGQLLDRIVYQEVVPGVITCPPNLNLMHAPDGSNPFSVYHS